MQKFLAQQKKMRNFAPQKAKRPKRKDAGVAERGGLENRYTGNCIQGSNPCLSAKKSDSPINGAVAFSIFYTSRFPILFDSLSRNNIIILSQR